MVKKFEADEEAEVEDCFLVDGVWLPGREFDRHINKKLGRIDFFDDALEFIVGLVLCTALVMLFRG